MEYIMATLIGIDALLHSLRTNIFLEILAVEEIAEND
jgi:hypothetical protein